MLEVILVLAAAILIGNILAHKIRVTPAIVMIFVGLALALLPAMYEVREVGLPSHVILEIFLPLMLFWEARNTSLREIRKSLRSIITSGTTLVIVTALAVAWVLTTLFSLNWGTALIIGAALAPTDATAVATLNGKLPKRTITVLKAESLINDGTTLVVFALALLVAGGSSVSTSQATGMLAYSFLCGIAVGLLVGWIANKLRAHLENPMNYTLFMVGTPFAAFLLSESLEIAEGFKGSGVVAVVVAAFYMTYNGVDTIKLQNRFYGLPIWAFLSYLMNGAIFVLVGVQLPEIWSQMGEVAAEHHYSLWAGVQTIVVAWLVSLAVRFVFMRPSMVLDIRYGLAQRYRSAGGKLATGRTNRFQPGRSHAHSSQRREMRRLMRDMMSNPQLRREMFRDRVVSTMAGLRGGVSLAVALSVGVDIPNREFIIFVVAAVVILSMVVQGLTLPAIIRWAKIPADDSEERETQDAARQLQDEALRNLDEIAASTGVTEDALEHVRFQMQFQRDNAQMAYDMARSGEVSSRDELKHSTPLGQVYLLEIAVINYQREVLKRLRNEGAIDMNVLHTIQERLDNEEIRLVGPYDLE